MKMARYLSWRHEPSPLSRGSKPEQGLIAHEVTPLPQSDQKLKHSSGKQNQSNHDRKGADRYGGMRKFAACVRLPSTDRFAHRYYEEDDTEFEQNHSHEPKSANNHRRQHVRFPPTAIENDPCQQDVETGDENEPDVRIFVLHAGTGWVGGFHRARRLRRFFLLHEKSRTVVNAELYYFISASRFFASTAQWVSPYLSMIF